MVLAPRQPPARPRVPGPTGVRWLGKPGACGPRPPLVVWTALPSPGRRCPAAFWTCLVWAPPRRLVPRVLCPGIFSQRNVLNAKDGDCGTIYSVCGEKRARVNSEDVSSGSNLHTMSRDLKSKGTGLPFPWRAGSFGCCSQKPEQLDQQRQWPQHEQSVGKAVKVTLEKGSVRAPPRSLCVTPTSPLLPKHSGFSRAGPSHGSFLLS